MSRVVDRGTPNSDDRFCIDFAGENSLEAATTARVVKRVVFLPLRGLSLTLPRANARFSQSISDALLGGALLNRSQTQPSPCACSPAPTHLPPSAPQ